MDPAEIFVTLAKLSNKGQLNKFVDVATSLIPPWYKKRKEVEFDLDVKRKEADLKITELYHIEEMKRRLREQDNIVQIVANGSQAYEEENRESENSQTTENIDPDWLTSFEKYARDVSDNKMQIIWGRILAGEVLKPGCFSARTLHFIKHLRQDEAQLITQFGTYTWLKLPSSNYFHIRSDENDSFLLEGNFGFDKLIQGRGIEPPKAKP